MSVGHGGERRNEFNGVIVDSLSEQLIQCPYCGESISVLIDPTEAGMNYIEDCQVCCRPIEFLVVEDFDGSITVHGGTDNE